MIYKVSWKVCKHFLDRQSFCTRTKLLQWMYASRSQCLVKTAAENGDKPNGYGLRDKARDFVTAQDGAESVVFYRWPTMRHFRFISRFKVYQVSTMLLLLLPMGGWYNTGVISGQTFTYALISAAGTTLVLSVLSYYFTRVAGELALIRDKSLVRVSTLTFMGGRRDILYPVGNIVPYSDTQTKVGGAIQRLEVIGENTFFMYSLRYGHVINRDVMWNVLGIM